MIQRLLMLSMLCSAAIIVVCTSDPAGPENGDGQATCPVIKEVSSSINESVTWHSDTVYLITDNDFWVGDSATLTILPGTIIKIKENYKIRVSGNDAALIAEGTADSMIVFTSINDDAHGCATQSDAAPDSGDWRYLEIDRAGAQSRFSFCKFLYGGRGNSSTQGVLNTGDSAAHVSNCVFAHNAGLALNAARTLKDATIKNNVFYNNGSPLQISAGISLRDEDGNRFDTIIDGQSVSNRRNAIFVNSYAGSGDPLSNWPEHNNVLWGVTAVPYVMQHDISIDEGNVLQVMDNVVVKVKSSLRISFYYTTDNLYVSKSAIFTSYNDDSRGGDTNADGDATEAAQGDWDGIKGSGTAADPTNTPWVINNVIYYDTDHGASAQEYDFPIPKL